MASPNAADYLNLINGTPTNGGTPSLPQGWQVLVQPVSNSTTGLVAAAYYNAAGQIVAVFEGVSTPSGNRGATSADFSLLAGHRPPDYDSAVSGFATEVEAAAVAKGLSTAASNIFATGNSLGGYAAQEVAQARQWGGASFGGPGLPDYIANSSSNPNKFISYVNTGDPIANRATDATLEWGGLVSTDNAGAHFGEVKTIGPQVNQTGLQNWISALTAPGATGDMMSAASGALLGMIQSNHSLSSYAKNLGVTITTPNFGLSSDLLEAPILLEQSLDGITAPLTLGTNSDGNLTITVQNGSTTDTDTIWANAAAAGDIAYQHTQSISGNPSLEALTRIGTSGQIMTDISDYSAGRETSETVNTASASGTPEDAVAINFGAGSNPVTSVTVRDAAGHTQNYTMSGTPGVEDLMDAAAVASGAGPTILIGGDNAKLTGSGGQNLIIELGNNDTAIAGSGATQIVVGGSNDYVTGSGVNVTTLTNGSFNLSGNNDTITLGANSYAGLLGGTGIVVNNDVAGDTVNITSGAAATINGSGGYLGICGTNVTVAASNESIGTISGASFNLSGGYDTINLGANSYAGLLGGSGIVVNNDVAGDTVNLTSNTSATINGSGGYVGICGTNIWVTASNESIATVPSASFNLSGGSDGITLGANSYLGLLGGSGYMVWGSGDTIATWANTSLNLQGNNDTIGLGGSGDYLGLLGGSGYTVYGSGDTINTWANTSLNLQGSNDGVYLGGTGDYLGLLGGSGYMVYGTGDTIATWDNTSVNLQGGNDTIYLGAGDTLGLLSGSGYTAYGSGDTIWTWGGTSFNLSGNNDTLYLGTSNYLDFFGGSGDTVNGVGVGSGGSAVTETVTTNPDGSWVDHLVDTGSQFGWTEEQFVHAANNSLAEETINYDNGWHIVSYFDPYNQFTWAQQTKTYNAQGRIASWTYDHQAGEVVTNDDGSVATTYYGADGVNVNEVQVSIPGGGSAQYWVNRVNPANNAYGGNAGWFQSADWTGGPSGGGFGDVGVTDLYFDPFTGYFDPNAIADDGLSYFPLDAVDDGSDFEIFVDPLVLNLGGGKVTTTARGESGVAFDMRGDGGQQATGWITPDEGFLAVDKEHTGRITSSHDMISDLNELASFDDNHDGAITAADGRFGDLRVWVPDDQGGTGRLDTLARLGITGIDLTSAAVAGQADHGNRINSTFRFSYADGTSGEGADVSFLTGTDALLHAMASFAPAAPVPANMPPASPAPEHALAAAH